MKQTIGIILFLISCTTFSQTARVNSYNPLTPIDTIISSKKLNITERIDSLNATDYFFTYSDPDYKRGLLLTKNHIDKWVVYNFDSELINSPNTKIDTIIVQDNKYINIHFSRFSPGDNSAVYSFLIILNIETCKIIGEFCTHHFQQCYNENGVVTETECQTKTTIENGILTLKSSDNPDGLYCSESMVYKIENDSLKKLSTN